MQTTFKNAMVAHIWAQQSQERGHSGNWSFYFEKETIYSYRDTFPLARFVTIGKGKNKRRCVLITSEGYSHTTDVHRGLVKGAIPSSVPEFLMPGLLIDPTEEGAKKKIRAFYNGLIQERLTKAARARTEKEWHLTKAEDLRKMAQSFSDFFKWGWKVPELNVDPEVNADLEAIKENLKIQAAKDKRKKDRRCAEQRKQSQDLFIAWRDGLQPVCPVSHRPDDGTDLLTVCRDRILTSQRAEIPVAHAARVYKALKAIKARVPQPVTCSIRVGHFTIEAMDGQGTITAGCHKIKWEEIERIAQILKL